MRLNQYGGTLGRPPPERQDALFRDLGADAPANQLRHDLHCADPAQPRRAIFPICAVRREADLDLRPSTGSTAATRQPFAGNVIPADALRPGSAGRAELLPAAEPCGTAPMPTISSASSRNESATGISWSDGWIISSARRDLVTARYYINDANTNNSGTYGIPAADPLADITDVRVQSILGAHTHIFSPTLDQRFPLYLPAPQVHRFASRLWREPGRENRADGRYATRRFRPSRFPAMASRPGSRRGNVTIPTTGAALGQSHRGLPLPDAHPRPAVSGCAFPGFTASTR